MHIVKLRAAIGRLFGEVDLYFLFFNYPYSPKLTKCK